MHSTFIKNTLQISQKYQNEIRLDGAHIIDYIDALLGIFSEISLILQ